MSKRKSFLASHIEKAREEHERFKQGKGSSVTDFWSEVADRENRKTIGFANYRQLLSALNKIDSLAITYKADDLKCINEYLSKVEREHLLEEINRQVQILIRIQRYLQNKK